MHPNPIFRDTLAPENIAFARERGFGVLSVNGTRHPMLSHVPFFLAEDAAHADLHLVRSNLIARACKPSLPACIAVSGPDSYVSPDWYGIEDQVPTWNYVAVHLIGTLEPMPDNSLPALLDKLSDHFESRLLPKPPWLRRKMSDGTFDRMARMIQPFRFHVSDIQGTWKLNQNKSDAVRHAAADHTAAYGIGSDVRALAALIHGVPDQGE